MCRTGRKRGRGYAEGRRGERRKDEEDRLLFLGLEVASNARFTQNGSSLRVSLLSSLLKDLRRDRWMACC